MILLLKITLLVILLPCFSLAEERKSSEQSAATAWKNRCLKDCYISKVKCISSKQTKPANKIGENYEITFLDEYKTQGVRKVPCCPEKSSITNIFPDSSLSDFTIYTEKKLSGDFVNYAFSKEEIMKAKQGLLTREQCHWPTAIRHLEELYLFISPPRRSNPKSKTTHQIDALHLRLDDLSWLARKYLKFRLKLNSVNIRE